MRGLRFAAGVWIAGAGLMMACGSSSDAGSGTAGVLDGGGAANGVSGGTGTGSTGSGTGSTGSGTGSTGSGTGSTGNGTSGTSGGGTNGGGGAGSRTGGAVAIIDGGPVFGSTQCTNGKDDDGDGLSDAMDPECTGPLDNDEETFATGIPGDNQDPNWQDCFFDGDSGAGNDGCRYASGCLTGDIPQTDSDCQVSADCLKYCRPYAPNGCDCFGCCAVPLPSGGTKNVQIVGTCTLADVNDAQKCPPCTQATSCVNTCEKCELCLGKDTLPDECSPSPGTGGASNSGGSGGASNSGGAGGTAGGSPNAGGSGGTCAHPECLGGQQACGVSCLPACPAGQYCLTGCCIVPPA